MVCEVCNGSKHLMADSGKWVRCECLLEEMEEKRVAFLSSLKKNEIKESSLLGEYVNKTIRVVSKVKPLKYELAALMKSNRGMSILGRKVSDLLQDHLDTEKFSAKVYSADLLIIMLDGAKPNRFIPHLIYGIIKDRSAAEKGTWLVLEDWNVDWLVERLDPMKQYDNNEFRNMLESLEKVDVD